MPKDRKVDVVVIGSGPGGEGAAMQLAKGGRSVILVERYEKIGGGCTHWGTIPSKALRFAIYRLTEALNNPLLQACGVKVKPSVAELSKSAQKVIASQESMRRTFYMRNDVEVVHGHAKFVDANTISVNGDQKITTDHVVVAVGSRPYRPRGIDFTHPRIFDSDTILGLDHKPHSMTVLGAGVIGCEYASMFRNLAVKINLVNSRDELLDFLDDEISVALSYHMRERGVLIRHNESFERIEPREDGVIAHLKSGKQLKTDVLLWATGRTGNTQDLGLETIELEADGRGYVAVNNEFQTQVKNVYAVGDVVGFPSLASAAYTQGRAAGMNILGINHEKFGLSETIPSGIYTTPEISCIGKTEKELTEAKVPYEVGVANFKSLARAQIIGQEVGMLKILFHRESLKILGIHCFGASASEIIHIGQAVMLQDGEANSIKYFTRTTFNYPTMAEAYRVAALNGLNRLF
ncbi:MAG: Si-specific NAD(P)(+) transhydrogenase [Mariniblastus sp.]|nr:Si-specific NAD(P)(+) transhydrogenase [Mariniblastus sp.]